MRGVDRVPPGLQTSTPWTFFAMFLGASVALSSVIFGWVPVTFGLSFAATVSSILVGAVIGASLLIPMLLLGSRAGTNNATGSGAVFGVRGRLVGSALGWAINTVSAALAVWTGGSVTVEVAHRLLGIPNSPVALTITYALVAAICAAVAIWGYEVLRASTMGIFVAGGLLVLLIPVVLWNDIKWDYRAPDESAYALGAFWPTWWLSALSIGLGGVMIVATLTGDWTRYINPDRYPARRLAPIGFAALVIGFVIPPAIGAIAATAFPAPTDPLTTNLATLTPEWYAWLLLPLASLGTVGYGGAVIYSAGLDLAAVAPRLGRPRATVLVAAAAVVLVLLGAFATDIAGGIAAALTVLAALSAPWVVVVGLGFLRARGVVDPEALQVFNRGERGGPYWYRSGWRWQAVAAWAAGATIGLLTVQTPIFSGPLAGIAGGLDVSLLAAPLLAGALYLILVAAGRSGASSSGSGKPSAHTRTGEAR